MTLNRILLFPLFFISIYFTACTDEPSDLGSALLAPDEIIILSTDSDSMMQTSSTTLTQVPLGSSNRLHAGRHANLEASFLIRYTFAFPDSIKQDLIDDSLNVTSARITLNKVYTYGDTSGILDLVIEKVLSSWSSAGFIADSLTTLQTTPVAVDSLIITDTITSFKFDNALALEWMKIAAEPSSGSNWGLYIKPGTAANKVFGYQALIASAEGIPRLQIVLEKPGVYVDTFYYNPLSDISVLKNIAPYPSGEYMTVQAGLKIMSWLYFDISSLPEYAVINKAELSLISDTTLNIIGDLNNKVVTYVPGDTTNLDSIASVTVNLTKTGNTFTGNITSMVQDWLVRRDNRGLVITTSNELNGLERFVFWNSIASNPALKPRLVITYTNKL